ncbi:MAG: hypothetical protein ABR564_02995 [Candidatus Dormibacteria bacterium]
MAKKTKHKKKTAPQRRSAPPQRNAGAPTQSPAPPVAQAAQGAASAAVPTAPTVRRGVQRVDPAARRREAAPRGKGADAGFTPLDPEDAAIPFDRVPYVPADLRRVTLMAGIMVVLIIVANVVIARLTG